MQLAFLENYFYIERGSFIYWKCHVVEKNSVPTTTVAPLIDAFVSCMRKPTRPLKTVGYDCWKKKCDFR